MNDNDHRPIRMKDWREAVAWAPPRQTVETEDGWFITFGDRRVIPIRR